MRVGQGHRTIDIEAVQGDLICGDQNGTVHRRGRAADDRHAFIVRGNRKAAHGAVDADNLSPAELESLLVSRFRPDFLVNPRIFIQVVNYRPYYLVGEVQGTGTFPYVAGMTYLTAIAIAGGFSYRAKQDYVYVVRADDPTQQEVKLNVEEKVQPGDIIRVAERLF